MPRARRVRTDRGHLREARRAAEFHVRGDARRGAPVFLAVRPRGSASADPRGCGSVRREGCRRERAVSLRPGRVRQDHHQLPRRGGRRRALEHRRAVTADGVVYVSATLEGALRGRQLPILRALRGAHGERDGHGGCGGGKCRAGGGGSVVALLRGGGSPTGGLARHSRRNLERLRRRAVFRSVTVFLNVSLSRPRADGADDRLFVRDDVGPDGPRRKGGREERMILYDYFA
mmetsp:Transcript_14422/g.61872  ORF Transcript_14422/g.61872 Transcript_14422/m.61872 type:complete len:232 (+) Transcript_14422:1499-2194(+)